MKKFAGILTLFGTLLVCLSLTAQEKNAPELDKASSFGFDAASHENARQMAEEGKQTFRFDTFGDEAFWGDTLQL
ncbi:MAG: hypothetical protein WBD72_14570, partial [Candidatus Acidiferrum sp.]